MGISSRCSGTRNLISATYLSLCNWTQIGTAAAAMMAIRILLDHGVCEDRIVFITFVVARYGGISVLRRAFPGVRIVTGAVDNGLRDGWLVDMGNEGRSRNVWIIGNVPCMCHSQFIQMIHLQSRAWVRLVCPMTAQFTVVLIAGFFIGDRYYL